MRCSRNIALTFELANVIRRVPQINITWLSRPLCICTYIYTHIYTRVDDRDGDPLISWRVRRVTARTIPEIQRHWLSLVSCISLSLRFRLRILRVLATSPPLSPITNSNTGNRKADRNPTPWELASANPADRSDIDLLNADAWMQKKNDHIAFKCTKGVNKDEARFSVEDSRRWWRKGRWESIICRIVESLPGLDLQ